MNGWFAWKVIGSGLGGAGNMWDSIPRKIIQKYNTNLIFFKKYTYVSDNYSNFNYRCVITKKKIIACKTYKITMKTSIIYSAYTIKTPHILMTKQCKVSIHNYINTLLYISEIQSNVRV